MERAMVITVTKCATGGQGINVRASVSTYVDGVIQGLAFPLINTCLPEIGSDVPDEEIRCWLGAIVVALARLAEDLGCVHVDGPVSRTDGQSPTASFMRMV